MLQTRLRIVAALLASTGVLAAVSGLFAGQEAKASGQVTLLRVPDGGIQPQVASAAGTLHLLYFKGEPGNGDVFYVHSTDAGATFSRPLRVNSQPESVIAIGNIRGAHLAIGKKGRVHVAWFGSSKAQPRGPAGATPLLYTRLNEEGTAFEPQRNVIQKAFGLDGGGSVAAEGGNVYVAWHAPQLGLRGENNRCVWVARSTDEGNTFLTEKRAYAEPTGACGCCGLRAFADSKGTLYVLYRSAAESIHRDTYLLTSRDKGVGFQGANIHKWETETCPLSTMALAEGGTGTLAAWETAGQVYFASVDPVAGKTDRPIAAPGPGRGRKHPVLAVNDRGETILVWTEGMGWNRGGSLAWQVFDKAGNPTAERGRADGVPTWSLVAVFARPAGGFTIVY